MLTAVRSISVTQTARYDKETAHGCNAAPQATWSKEIDAALPAVKVP